MKVILQQIYKIYTLFISIKLLNCIPHQYTLVKTRFLGLCLLMSSIERIAF